MKKTNTNTVDIAKAREEALAAQAYPSPARAVLALTTPLPDLAEIVAVKPATPLPW